MSVIRVNLVADSAIRQRPVGTAVRLAGFRKQIASVLGIEPTICTDDDFIHMTREMVSKEDQTTCLLESESEIYVDLKVCRWCPRSMTCLMSGSMDGGKLLKFNIADGYSQRADYQIIEAFIEQGLYRSTMFPSKDPFQVGWASRGSRGIFIEPLNERIIQPSKQGISPWGAIYYSPALKNHLTLFEAQVLERMQRVIDTGDWNKAFDREEDILTAGEYLEWIEKEELDTSDVDSFWNSLKEAELLSPLEDLMTYTASNHSSGLYGVSTEISTHDDMDEEDLWRHAIKLLHSIWDGIDSDDVLVVEQPVIQPRLEVVLLLPDDAKGAPLRGNGFRIKRSIRVKGLVQPWLIMDNDFEKHPPFTIPAPPGGGSDGNMTLVPPAQTYSLPLQMHQEFHKRMGGIRFVDFNMLTTIEQDVKIPYLIHIPPSEWLAVNSVQRSFRDHVSAGYGADFYRIWNDFRKFLDHHGPLRTNISLRHAFADPVIRKLPPYEALLQLSSDGRLQPIGYRLYDPDLEDKQHEEFSIPVPSGMLTIARDRYRGKKKYIDGDKERSVSDFIITSDGGMKKKFCIPLIKALNWNVSEQKAAATVDDFTNLDLSGYLGAMWFSEGTIKLLADEESPNARILSQRVIRMIHSTGQKHVTCFSTWTELDEGRHPLFQSADHGSIFATHLPSEAGQPSSGWHGFTDCPVCEFPTHLPQKLTDDTILVWQPALAASEFSPQFVFLGGFGG